MSGWTKASVTVNPRDEPPEMVHKKAKPLPSCFQPEDNVRVRHGVRDPKFPDIPRGGWAGAVKEVHKAEGETTLLVAWNRATLRGMHSIYKKRCERDGLEHESILSEVQGGGENRRLVEDYRYRFHTWR